MKKPILEVDTQGLFQLIKSRGPGHLVVELIRNSLDEDGVAHVNITVEPLPNRSVCRVSVEDDAPAGFRDRTHAYTVFASSYKKSNPEKAGRFNLGEKLFLAACMACDEPAFLETTSGSITFDPRDGRTDGRNKREKGTLITGCLRMTRAQMEATEQLVRTLILPESVVVTYNGQALPVRKPLKTFTAKLATLEEDEEGALRNVPGGRETTVGVYEPLDGQPASIYELGVPVVETGDRYDVNVAQKVPLTMDRDNVPPAYLAKVRTLVVNEMKDALSPQDVNQAWVRAASSDKRITPEAMSRVLDLRFGEKRVAFDPSDREANNRATAEGYTVVAGGMMNKEEWENVRNTGTTPAAGRVFPTPKPYSNDPNAPLVDVIPEGNWTAGMRRAAKFAKFLHMEAYNEPLTVRMVNTSNGFAACYSPGALDFNLRRLGHKFFNELGPKNLTEVVQLLIHEFGHHRTGNHLSGDYHDELCELGAKFMTVAFLKAHTLDEMLQ